MGQLYSAIKQYAEFGFGKARALSEETIAQYSLRNNMSYRLDASAPTDRLIGLREWYRHVIKTNGQSPFFQQIHDAKEGHALITWDYNKDPKALEYVQFFHSKPVTHFVGKDLISLRHLSASWYEYFFLHVFSLWVTVFCFCFKNNALITHYPSVSA